MFEFNTVPTIPVVYIPLTFPLFTSPSRLLFSASPTIPEVLFSAYVKLYSTFSNEASFVTVISITFGVSISKLVQLYSILFRVNVSVPLQVPVRVF